MTEGDRRFSFNEGSFSIRRHGLWTINERFVR